MGWAIFTSWRGCFLTTAAVVLVQLIPGVGYLMLLVFAPFWPVVLVNLGFALMAREALTRRGSLWLIAGPMFWFGGYVAVSAASHWQAGRLNAELAAANEAARIDFDWQSQDLLIEPHRGNSNNGSPLEADRLILGFDIGRVFQAFGGETATIRKTALVEQDCPGPGIGIEGGVHYRNLSDGGYPSNRPMRFANGLCLLSSEDRPDRAVVRVQAQAETQGEGLVLARRQDLVVTPPGGEAMTLKTGSFQPLSWFPIPIFACGIQSGGKGCEAMFWRESLYDPQADRAPNGADDVLARALGLRKASVAERYADVEWSDVGSRPR